MKAYIVDASVAVKWYIPEPQWEAAEQLLQKVAQGRCRLYAPELIYAEIGNVLWKKCRRGELDREEASAIIEAIVNKFPVRTAEIRPLLPAALEIAWEYGRTVYDSLYIALAVAKDSVFVTADEKFANAVKPSPINEFVKLLKDFEP